MPSAPLPAAGRSVGPRDRNAVFGGRALEGLKQIVQRSAGERALVGRTGHDEPRRIDPTADTVPLRSRRGVAYPFSKSLIGVRATLDGDDARIEKITHYQQLDSQNRKMLS